MVRMQSKRARGFTLVELMIVVAIIGVLASVAIPSFVNYQLTSKRAEAFSNLSSLANMQKSYFAEFNTFISVPSEPTGGLGLGPSSIKRVSTSINGAFAAVGWVPEGDVFFDYDTATPSNPLTGSCQAGAQATFTATAYGDLDGDGLLSVVIYAHPDNAGLYCGTGQAGDLSPPINPISGGMMFDEPARVIGLLADDF